MRHGGWFGAGLFAVACACGCLGSLDYLGDASGGNTGTGAAGGQAAGSTSATGGGGMACGDLTTPDNCGACGHSCFGGECVEGVCQPVVVASGQDEPFGIGVDDNHVYWSNRGSREIRRAPRMGGGDELVAASDTSPVAFVPTFLVVLPTLVAWTNVNAGSNSGYALVSWTKSGGEPQGFAGGSPDGNAGLAAVEASFYFGNFGAKDIRSAELGEAFVPIATTPSGPAQVAADQTHVYWTLALEESNSVVRIPRQPEASSESLSPDVREASGITLDDSFVYVTSVNEIVRIPKQGGAPEVLAGSQFQPTGIAVYGDLVYWTSGSGEVLSTLKTGGAEPTVIATAQDSPTLVVVDEEQIYWTNAGDAPGSGSVMRVAR